MKKLAVSVALMLIASPTFAHNGHHVHPHGMELTLAVLSFIAVAIFNLARRNR